MFEVGRRIGAATEAGDLIVLDGVLGAGKTTLAQGIGRGLGVRGPITSPTFVIARVHPSLSRGPDLVHVDAYRLGSLDELDDLDLDASMTECVTVVEWGKGLVEVLADEWLQVTIDRSFGTAGDGDESRTVTLLPFGERWAAVLPSLVL
ncbi:MAG: tRNA (adenosine(37)-N6)-threonylcarbamoyltransferase complex ATPase subunit type 1 TsaE [Actinomycetes bacterium]